MRYKVSLSMVVARRVQQDDEINCDYEYSRYGFYWWFWKPRYIKCGKFESNERVDVTLQWLCFSIGLIFRPDGKDS